MAKIFCADAACKYWDRNKCKAKEVQLSWASIMTVHEGRQEILRCKTRQDDEQYLELQKRFAEIFTEGRDAHG